MRKPKPTRVELVWPVSSTPGEEVAYALGRDEHLFLRPILKSEQDAARYLKAEETAFREWEKRLAGDPRVRHCAVALSRILAAKRALVDGDLAAAIGYAREIPGIRAALAAERDRTLGENQRLRASKANRKVDPDEVRAAYSNKLSLGAASKDAVVEELAVEFEVTGRHVYRLLRKKT